MKTKTIFVWGLLVLLIGGGVWWFLHRHAAGGDEADAELKATAQVELAPLKKGTIEKTIVAYGTAIAPAGGTRSISYPLESRVTEVDVSVGQRVNAGDTVLKIELSTDARLALETARGAKAAADRMLNDVEHRIQAQLATNQDLVAAQTAANDAATKLTSMEQSAPGADGSVKAPVSGIVTKSAAQPGMVMAAGNQLMEIAAETGLEAQLGVTPGDAGEVKEGNVVRLYPVERGSGGDGDDAKPIAGKIRLVGRSVDPATQLVDAFAVLDGGTDTILIGSYLRAEIVVDTKETLLAPREAVVPGEEGKGGEIFTTKDGKAEKQEVEVGLDDGTNVEVSGSGDWLKPGTQVVTTGAAELEDGMAVTTGSAGADDDKAGGKAGGEKEGKEP